MSTPQPIEFGSRPVATPSSPQVADFAITSGSPPAVVQPMKPITVTEASSFGKDALTRASSIADQITGVARCGDIDEIGQKFNALLVTAKKYDPSVLKKGGFLGFFKVKVQELKNQFATVDQQVDRLVAEADHNVALFAKRIGDIEHLYDENETRFHELGALADEFERRVAWMDATPPAVDATDTFSAQHLADWKGAADMGRKQADNLRRAQALCQMNAPMLKMMETNAASLVNTFGDIKTHSIPALKWAFASYILNMEMEKGAAFGTAVQDLTNETIRKNAEKLGIATVAVQTAAARSSVDLATLQAVSTSTLKAIDDAQRIRTEMRARLQQEQPQIEALSLQLTQRLAA